MRTLRGVQSQKPFFVYTGFYSFFDEIPLAHLMTPSRWEALMDEIGEAVGEPLHLIGEPPASVKDLYEKQPVSAPLAVSMCELCNPVPDCACCWRVG